MIDKDLMKKAGIFAGGVLFGTAGVKLLGSADAKKFYVNCLAAGLRAKDSVMTTAENIQENAEDIFAEAQEINRQREEAAAAAEEACQEEATEKAEAAQEKEAEA